MAPNPLAATAPPDLASVPVVRLRIDGSVWRLLAAALVGAVVATAVGQALAWRADSARSPQQQRLELDGALLSSQLLARELIQKGTLDAREAGLLLSRTLAALDRARGAMAVHVHSENAYDLKEAADQLDRAEKTEAQRQRWIDLAQAGHERWRLAELGGGTAATPLPDQAGARSRSEELRQLALRHRAHARWALQRLVQRHGQPTAVPARSLADSLAASASAPARPAGADAAGR